MSNYNINMNSNSIALISRIRESANRLILNELAKAGITELAPSHGDILVLLMKNKKMTMQEVAKRIHRTKATTTVLIDKLEKIGFVKREKSEDDSRYTNVVLTDKGQEFKPVFEEISNKLISTAYSGLSQAEIEQLETILEKIMENLG